MNAVVTWKNVRQKLRMQPQEARLALPKVQFPHPREAGARISVGLPEQFQGENPIADFRFPADATGGGLHVREYSQHWVAHLDLVHPARDFLEHVRVDAPRTFVAGGAGLGAAIGAATGRSWGATLLGAGIGLAVAAALTKKP